MAAGLPTLSDQKLNCILRSNTRLLDHIETVTPLPASDIKEGEWVKKTASGWARVVGTETHMVPCVIMGKSREHMRQVMQANVGDSTGEVPIYLGPLPIVLDTKIYDAGGDYVFAAGDLVYIKSVTVVGGTYAGTWAMLTKDTVNALACGTVLMGPSEHPEGFLRVQITFA